MALFCWSQFDNEGFIYLFLVERVRLVRGGDTIPRLKDKVFLANTSGLLLWIVVIGLSLHYRLSVLDDGKCYIGAKPGAPNVALTLVFDIAFNVTNSLMCSKRRRFALHTIFVPFYWAIRL